MGCMDGELEQLGERIAEQAAHLDAAMHRLLTDLREFNVRGGWFRQGAMSCAHWLAWRVGWDLVTARERVRVAERLAEFPTIDDSLRRGEVSYSKVRAMMRVATPTNETLLLEYARLMTASQLEKLCRKYAVVQRHGQDLRPNDDSLRRYVSRRDTDDGMVKIEAVLHPEEAEMMWTMLNHAATQLTREAEQHGADEQRGTDEQHVTDEQRGTDEQHGTDEQRGKDEQRQHGTGEQLATGEQAATGEQLGAGGSAESDAAFGAGGGAAEVPREAQPTSVRAPSGLRQRVDAARRAFNRADALISVVQAYLRGDKPERSPIDITLTVPVEGLRAGAADPLEVGEIGEVFVSKHAARRLSCDAGVAEVVEGERGDILSVGRKRRVIAGGLKRALLKRDQQCTFPTCTNRLFLEGHHIEHWADGGETSLSNGLILCSHHHRYVHEYGYTVEIGPDQRPQFRDRHGWLVAAVPGTQAKADLGWPRIREMNQPLLIDAETIACEWDGRPVDYGAVVGYLVRADGLS
jgi:hypothetical protein